MRHIIATAANPHPMFYSSSGSDATAPTKQVVITKRLAIWKVNPPSFKNRTQDNMNTVCENS